MHMFVPASSGPSGPLGGGLHGDVSLLIGRLADGGSDLSKARP